jgi:hypothetical protein
MINSRTKGNRYELDIIKLFKSLGWEEAVSSRSESKRKDDAGIDICYTDPFHIQAKAWERAPSYHEVLKSMPQIKGKYNLIFHKRNRQGAVVVLSQEDFLELLDMLIANQIIKPNV